MKVRRNLLIALSLLSLSANAQRINCLLYTSDAADE